MLLPADGNTGYVRVADTHGAVRRCDYTMQIPADGSYSWGVQAIDAANRGGMFATSAIDLSGVGNIMQDNAVVSVEGGIGEIRINAPEGATAAIYTTSGVLSRSITGAMPATVSAEAGLYIVNVETTSGRSVHKIVVE